MKKIKFIKDYRNFPAQSTVDLPAPSPASKAVPEWYAKSERFVGSNKPVIKNLSLNAGLKACVPFLDALTSGYVMTTWTDIQVTPINEDQVELTWLVEPSPLSVRPPEVGSMIPRPAGHFDTHFIWHTQFGIEAPTGYSLLYTHPLNRFDLPFTTLSGLVDSDKYPGGGNLPFFVKKGFEGIIPAGTPFVQLIPIKREVWESEMGTEKDTNRLHQIAYNSRAVASGFYKRNLWSRKEYK